MNTVGRYRDGHTFVTWFQAPDNRHREIVSENEDQAKRDVATAQQYLALPELVIALQDIEIRLDAMLHPVFDMDSETATALAHEAHTELRRLLGMPEIAEAVYE